MSKPVELKFHIDAFSPQTIPMESLAAYLLDLAVVLGEPHSVHFDHLEGGSTSPVVRVDHEAVPTVLKRAHSVRVNEGPVDAQRAKTRLERRLVLHNAKNAEVTDESGARILYFRGREAPQEVYGPVRQAGEIVGSVILIGGKNDPVSVHLKDGDRTYNCEAKLEILDRIRPHLLTGEQVRVIGYGRYFRNDQGEWEMLDFKISDLEVLNAAPFTSVLQDLRRVKSPWLEGDDPIGTLKKSE